ncbi:MAG: peptidoglycan-binding protein [Oscillospiraceae bacterium]|nr:peptidoglycan-binding protein [Oscillospiraceae bacterium]
MRPPESFVVQPVRSLQTMLRVIAESDASQPSVIPDGIYGQNTMAAVSAFQRRKGLPVTGTADQTTWDLIVADYEPALILVGEAQPIEVILDPNQVIRMGEQHPNLYLAQGMLIVLSQAYGSIPEPAMSGILDLPTSNSLSAFQALNLLPATGELDKITWNALANHYPLASRLITNPKTNTTSNGNSPLQPRKY